MVCTRVPHQSRAGKRRTRVWEVDATTNAILELAEHLAREGIEKVTLESTSDYWRIWFYLLEAAGLDVQLVHARDVKHAPGRPKTDKLDAVWLAKLTERGMLRPSFVPPAEIRQLRDYTRLRTDLARERTRHWSAAGEAARGRADQGLRGGQQLDTMSVRDMIEALIAGERDPRSSPSWPGAGCGPSTPPGRGAHRPVRRPPRRAGPDAAGPDRRPHRPDRHAHRPDRGADRCDPRRPGHRRRRHHRPGRRTRARRPGAARRRPPRRGPRHRPARPPR